MSVTTTLTAAERRDLRRAVALLENDTLLIRLTSLLGRGLEGAALSGARLLPEPARAAIRAALEHALGVAFDAAASSVRGRTGVPLIDRVLQARWVNVAGAMVSGAGGGLAGLPGVIAELPLTTTLLMRAIVQAAAQEGEDLSTSETRLECLNVFALGSPHAGDEEAELGYYAVRVGLARALGGLAGRTVNQMLPQAVTVTATRFGLPVAAKVAAEAVPLIGAATGAMVNGVFADHFQGKARGHFTVRRLERRYGAAAVQQAYEAVRDGQDDGSG